jgi:hypothetical protein
MKCCICKGEIEKQYTEEGEMFWDQGNNAQPIDDGRCCNECNATIVIPARLTEIKLKMNKSGS